LCYFLTYFAHFVGLAPGKSVGLKYAYPIRCDSFDKNGAGEVSEIRCTRLPVTDKPKGTVQWVAESNALKIEVRLYGHLFTVEEVDDEIWEEQLNPASEIVVSDAVVS
jgi:glutaminyl-tRNA synthetase